MHAPSKNILAHLLLLALFSNCDGEKASHSFQEIKCDPELVVGNSKIFTPCKSFIYSAKYWNDSHELISQSHVQMTPFKETAPDAINSELLSNLQFTYDDAEVEFIRSFNINTEFEGRSWLRNVSSLYKEDDNDVWMQPFRENQFVFTQIAPFPSVSLPLALGKQWTSNLIIYEGWGDWNNQQLISNYQVIENSKLTLGIGTLENVWHISSYVETAFGTSTHDFWFHESYGFVKMLYKNFHGQLLLFELEQLKW